MSTNVMPTRNYLPIAQTPDAKVPHRPLVLPPQSKLVTNVFNQASHAMDLILAVTIFSFLLLSSLYNHSLQQNASSASQDAPL